MHGSITTVWFAVESDYKLINQPTVIPVGVSDACFQLAAVEDMVIEDDKNFTLVVETANSNDKIVGKTTFLISDNDGKVRHGLNFMVL